MAKTLAIVFGIVFVLVGILGFIDSALVGETGMFVTNMLHDVVHLVFGLILLGVAFMAPAKSAMWLKILGIVYLILAVLGFLLIPEGGTMVGVLMNTADHWLHLILGIVLLAGGMMGGKSASAPSGGMPMSSPSM